MILPFSTKPFVADVSVVGKRCRAEQTKKFIVRDIGDLAAHGGLTEYRADDFFLAAKDGNLELGDDAEFFFYRKNRAIEWNAENFTEKFSPDAIYRGGAWLQAASVLPKIENNEN